MCIAHACMRHYKSFAIYIFFAFVCCFCEFDSVIFRFLLMFATSKCCYFLLFVYKIIALPMKWILIEQNTNWVENVEHNFSCDFIRKFVKRPNDQIILNDSTRNMLLCIKSHRNIDEHFQYLLKWTIKLNNASMVCMWITGKVFVQMNSSKGTTELQMITYILSRLIVTKTGKITFYEKQWRILFVLWTIDIQNMWNQTFLWMCWRGRDRKREREIERWRAWHHSTHCIDNAFHY